jgi:hypothetical protein
MDARSVADVICTVTFFVLATWLVNLEAMNLAASLGDPASPKIR